MGVQNYLDAIVNGRGMARSNTYAVYFTLPSQLQTYMDGKGRGGRINAPVSGNRSVSAVGERILLMCDEVSLPGIQSNTGSITGRYQGQGPIYYPTSPIYTDLQLSFMCDAEMQAFKFLLDWHDFIYDTIDSTNNPGSGVRVGEKSRKLKYPEQYQCTLHVQKKERNKTDEIGVSTMEFILNNAWPYSIDSIPLSYGSSQLVKCTANFYYTSWDRNPINEKGLPWPNR